MANGEIIDIKLTGDRIGSTANNGHDIDIDKLAGSLARLLEDVPQYMCTPGHPGRISRIPDHLRELDFKAYEPYFLSIGPYHHGKAMVQSMEKKKHLALKCALDAKPELTLKDYLSEMKSVEPAARSFYSDIEMESPKFVQMLLLDSMFLLAAFCGMATRQDRMNRITDGTSDHDNNENKHITVEEVEDTRSKETRTTVIYSASFQHDLLLLENQLPFFVLEKMYALVYGNSKRTLLSIMKYKVADLILGYTNQDPEMVISPTTEVHHLLHLCHMFFHPTIQPESTAIPPPVSSQMFRLGSAAQLYETGVNFVARSGSAQQSLLDITFSSLGTMIMPNLCVDDNTNSLLRNLIALEQMKYPNMGLNVSAYAVLLLHLITTPEDVELLRKKEVIQHHLASDKEMMYLVNKLSVGLSFDYVEDRYNLKPIFHELNRYSEHRVSRWRTCFKNPWTMISLLAGLLLLILSVVETFYTVYFYYNPRFYEDT